MRIASIHIYPVKGARAIDLIESDVLVSGLRHDRRFLVVDASGKFLTQRSHPRLALVETAIEDGLVLTTDQGSVRVPLAGDGPRTRVRVWKDEIEAVASSNEASAFLSDHLGLPCTLVFMPGDVVRAVEAPHGREGDRVGFADAYPVLLASLASLASLNALIEADGKPPVPMSRFRPNIVVEGGEAYDEERFPRARIGDLTFRMPKRCSRCEVTMVDQKTAAIGKEPLRTLAKHRKENNNVYFAMNLIPDGEGHLTIGDAVTYISDS